MKNKVNTYDIGQEERIECFLRGAMTSEEERRFLGLYHMYSPYSSFG